jgi:hypothetical protein
MSHDPDANAGSEALDGRALAGRLLWPSAIVLLVSVLLQAAIAGGSSFGAPAWRMHVMLGMLIVLLAVAVMVIAFLADARRSVRLVALAVTVLAVLQPVFSMLARQVGPWFGLLHSVGAFVMFGLVVWLVLQRGSARGSGSLTGA